MTSPPLAFRWDGEVFRPLRPKKADEYFAIGEVYWLEESSERSLASHQHQFAWLNAAWTNLPEPLMDTFPTSEHLRKAALIACGWHTQTILDAGNARAAADIARYIRSQDDFISVTVRGKTVTVRKARSQRMHGLDRMSKAEFQKSKDDIIGWVSQLIGVEPDLLEQAS